MFDLANKVAIVTGARRGMGKAHALALARQKASVIVTDINKDECQKVAKGDSGVQALDQDQPQPAQA